MTQDCSNSPSTATDCTRIPNGIHVVEVEHGSASAIEIVSTPQASKAADDSPWSYLFLHNMKVRVFEQDMETYNLRHQEAAHACFVHRSYAYAPKTERGGVKKTYKPTVSGLVFLQGHVRELQAFLRQYYPQYHLVNDCSQGKPASIPHAVMKPFMQVLSDHPERVTFLREPFEKFAQNRTKLRVLTGLFKGYEGYIVRIDRDRQLVFDFGGYAVALRGVHNEDFEVAE